MPILRKSPILLERFGKIYKYTSATHETPGSLIGQKSFLRIEINKNMEKFLLKNMTQVLLTLCGMIFFTWLFQYLDFSFLNPINIPFLKEYKFE
jgi:hypothetical protein